MGNACGRSIYKSLGINHAPTYEFSTHMNPASADLGKGEVAVDVCRHGLLKGVVVTALSIVVGPKAVCSSVCQQSTCAAGKQSTA